MFWKRSISLVIFCAALVSAAGVTAAPERTLRIVLVPERNIFAQERKYRNMCDFLCAELPGNVSFEVLKSYRDVMRQMESGQAQAGFLGSFIGLHGIVMHGFIPLVRPQWPDGESTYSGVVFTTAASEVTGDVATWQGKTIAMVSRHTSAGFFYPMALVRNAGYKEPEKFFRRQLFAGSHDGAVWMVAKGLADLGAAKNTIFDETLNRKPELKDQIKILSSGGAFPDSTLMVRPDVPETMRKALKNTLLGLSSSERGKRVLEKFGAQRFVEADVTDFDSVMTLVKQAGYDINDINVIDH